MKSKKQYKFVEPQYEFQQIFRAMMDAKNSQVKVAHCKICGDTEEQSKLVFIETDKLHFHLCEFCHNIQLKM